MNKQSSLQARDILKLNPDRGQSDRRTNETQAQWAQRMQNEAKEAERRLNKFRDLQSQYNNPKSYLSHTNSSSNLGDSAQAKEGR